MKFKEYLNNVYDNDVSLEERTLLESGASLSRIISTLKSDVDFVMITAFRKGTPYKQNQKNNNSLLKQLRSSLGNQKAYGAYRLVGHWKECSVTLPDGVSIDKCSEHGGDIKDCSVTLPDGVSIDKCSEHGGDIKDSIEESWLVINDQKNPDFFKTSLDMAKKYKQDAIVARINNDFGLFGKGGDKWEDFGKVSNKSIDYGFNRIIGIQGFTELKKMRRKGRIVNIIFEGVSIPNPSNLSSMLYKSMNLLY